MEDLSNYDSTRRGSSFAKRIYYFDKMEKIGDRQRFEGKTMNQINTAFCHWRKRKAIKWNATKWIAIDGAVWVERIS